MLKKADDTLLSFKPFDHLTNSETLGILKAIKDYVPKTKVSLYDKLLKKVEKYENKDDQVYLLGSSLKPSREISQEKLDFLDKIAKIPLTSSTKHDTILISDEFARLRIPPNTNIFRKLFYRLNNIINTGLAFPKANADGDYQKNKIAICNLCILKYPQYNTITLEQLEFIYKNQYMYRLTIGEGSDRIYPVDDYRLGVCLFGHNNCYVNDSIIDSRLSEIKTLTEGK